MNQPATATHDGVVETVADGGVIRFERLLAYPVEEVWDAVTSPERLAEWWLPFDADVTVDLRVGGAVVFTGRGAEPFVMTHTITRLEPPTDLECTHGDDGSLVRWQLREVPGGCELRLSHFLPHPDVVVTQPYVVGLHTSLSRLEPCLAGRPVPWDWEAFARDQAAYAALGLAPAVAP